MQEGNQRVGQVATSAAYFQVRTPWKKAQDREDPDTRCGAIQAAMLAARNRRATFSGYCSVP